MERKIRPFQQNVENSRCFPGDSRNNKSMRRFLIQIWWEDPALPFTVEEFVNETTWRTRCDELDEDEKVRSYNEDYSEPGDGS